MLDQPPYQTEARIRFDRYGKELAKLLERANLDQPATYSYLSKLAYCVRVNRPSRSFTADEARQLVPAELWRRLVRTRLLSVRVDDPTSPTFNLDANNTFSLYHTRLEKYLTARYLVDGRDQDERATIIRQHLHNPLFDDVILLALATCDSAEASYLIEKLCLDQARDPSLYENVTRHDLIFALRAATEAVVLQPEVGVLLLGQASSLYLGNQAARRKEAEVMVERMVTAFRNPPAMSRARRLYLKMMGKALQLVGGPDVSKFFLERTPDDNLIRRNFSVEHFMEALGASDETKWRVGRYLAAWAGSYNASNVPGIEDTRKYFHLKALPSAGERELPSRSDEIGTIYQLAQLKRLGIEGKNDEESELLEEILNRLSNYGIGAKIAQELGRQPRYRDALQRGLLARMHDSRYKSYHFDMTYIFKIAARKSRAAVAAVKFGAEYDPKVLAKLGRGRGEVVRELLDHLQLGTGHTYWEVQALLKLVPNDPRILNILADNLNDPQKMMYASTGLRVAAPHHPAAADVILNYLNHQGGKPFFRDDPLLYDLSLSISQNPAVLAFLLAALKGRHPSWLRAAIARGIGMQGWSQPEARAALIERVQRDKEGKVRAAAIEGLTLLKPAPEEAVLAVVERLSRDSDREVLATAAEALAKMSDNAGTVALLSQLMRTEGRDFSVRVAAARGLWNSGEQRQLVLDTFIDALTEGFHNFTTKFNAGVPQYTDGSNSQWAIHHRDSAHLRQAATLLAQLAGNRDDVREALCTVASSPSGYYIAGRALNHALHQWPEGKAEFSC